MPRATKAVDAANETSTKAASGAGAGKGAAAAAKEPPAAKSPARAPAKATTAKAPAAKAPAKAPAAKAPAEKVPAVKAPVGKAPVGKALPAKALPAKAVSARSPARVAPPVKTAPRAPTDKFLIEQLALLKEERATYEEQAAVLKAQADQMALEMEPGDIQFDDESGEGGTANIDRERDLALSAQARLAVDEIDHAMVKITNGTYGPCENCGQPILKARLKALPQARLCIACKSGGLSRR